MQHWLAVYLQESENPKFFAGVDLDAVLLCPGLTEHSWTFQRHHTSARCAAEKPIRFPWTINTTFKKKIYIRWCCIDRLSWHHLLGTSGILGTKGFLRIDQNGVRSALVLSVVPFRTDC